MKQIVWCLIWRCFRCVPQELVWFRRSQCQTRFQNSNCKTRAASKVITASESAPWDREIGLFPVCWLWEAQARNNKLKMSLDYRNIEGEGRWCEEFKFNKTYKIKARSTEMFGCWEAFVLTLPITIPNVHRRRLLIASGGFQHRSCSSGWSGEEYWKLTGNEIWLAPHEDQTGRAAIFLK